MLLESSDDYEFQFCFYFAWTQKSLTQRHFFRDLINLRANNNPLKSNFLLFFKNSDRLICLDPILPGVLSIRVSISQKLAVNDRDLAHG